MSPSKVVENGNGAIKDKKIEDLSSEEMTSKDYYFDSYAHSALSFGWYFSSQEQDENFFQMYFP